MKDTLMKITRPCGCWSDGSDLQWCSMHKAAPQLVEAIQIALDLTDKWKRTSQGADFFEVDSQLRKALATAERKTNA